MGPPGRRHLAMPVFAEGPDPLTVRLEPWGAVREVPRGGALIVRARGPSTGWPEIQPALGGVVVSAWKDSQMAFMDASAPPGDLDEFLARLSREITKWCPSRKSTFAAMIACRHLRDLGADGDTRASDTSPTPREIIEEHWTAVMTRAFEPRDARSWGRDLPVQAQIDTLRQVAAWVDPDRISAPTAYRALDVLGNALHAANATPSSHDLAIVALAARALTPASDDGAARRQIVARWAWGKVQDEARWLELAATALSLTDPLDRVAFGVLRAACVAPFAVAAAPGPQGASATSPEIAPRVVQLEVAGHRVSLIGVDANRRFRAEVDGARRPLRWRFEELYMSFGDSPSASRPWTQGTTAEIAPLLKCVDESSKRTDDTNGTTLEHHYPGANYGQDEWTTVKIAFTTDGALELDMSIVIDDRSYY